MRANPVAAAGLLFLVGASAGIAPAHAPAPPVRVKIEAEKLDISEPVALVDPRPHIAYRYNQMMSFGFVVDGNRITFGQDGSTNHTVLRIDGAETFVGNGPGQWVQRGLPLGPGPFGKKRNGTTSTFVLGKVHITQILEIVPSKLPPKAAPGQKRRLDTCLIRYIFENKDERPHAVGLRTMLDMLIVNNDGALFASPTTHPGKILNGVELRDKAVPEYLQVLQIPNLQNPGFVAHFTFKVGSHLPGPDRVVMTNLGAGGGQWEVPALMAGDSAIAVYFSPRKINAHGKVEVAYAYGQGIAANPENEGRVSLAFGGSFEPGKLFTVTAYVDEPVESQTLCLELPEGMTLIEGKARQPVPQPLADRPTSVVVWKGRVRKLGNFALKVHSSNGVSYTRAINITPADAPGLGPPAGAGSQKSQRRLPKE